MSTVNVSSDLLWAITRNNSSFIVKRGVGNGRVIFSREPLNLVNKHSHKYSGLVNEKVRIALGGMGDLSYMIADRRVFTGG